MPPPHTAPVPICVALMEPLTWLPSTRTHDGSAMEPWNPAGHTRLDGVTFRHVSKARGAPIGLLASSLQENLRKERGLMLQTSRVGSTGGMKRFLSTGPADKRQHRNAYRSKPIAAGAILSLVTLTVGSRFPGARIAVRIVPSSMLAPVTLISWASGSSPRRSCVIVPVLMLSGEMVMPVLSGPPPTYGPHKSVKCPHIAKT